MAETAHSGVQRSSRMLELRDRSPKRPSISRDICTSKHVERSNSESKRDDVCEFRVLKKKKRRKKKSELLASDLSFPVFRHVRQKLGNFLTDSYNHFSHSQNFSISQKQES
jgi:hypothetical protein